MTTETTTTETATETIQVGDRVQVVQCSPDVFNGYYGIVVPWGDGTADLGGGRGRGCRIHLEEGQSPVPGYEGWFPGPSGGEDQIPLYVREAVKAEKGQEVYRTGDLIEVVYCYGNAPGEEDSYYDGRKAEYVRAITEGDGEVVAHRVRLIEGSSVDVITARGVKRVNAAQIYRDAQVAVEKAGLAVEKAKAEINAEHEKWKAKAAIAAMKVAIENSMCNEAERAMTAAGLPTTMDAEVTLTVRLPLHLRDYVKAIDPPCGDDRLTPYSICNTLAALTGYPSYKWQKVIKSVEMGSAVGTSQEPIEVDSSESCECDDCYRLGRDRDED
jgi:hypothetical protein